MSRILLALGAMLVALSTPAAAQGGGGLDARIYRQLLDNDRVRVFEADFKPGDKLATRNFPTHLMYTLTDGTLVFVPEGRTGYEVNFKAGDAMWFPPAARATENDSDKEVRVLVVELKGGSSAASDGKARGKAKAKGRARPKAAAKPKTPGKK